MPNQLKYPTTTTTPNGTGSNGQWQNPANIFSDNASVASAAYLLDGGGNKTGLANLTAFGFGYDLPASAVIDGIQLEYEVTASNRWFESGSNIKLAKAGAAVGTNKAGAGSVASGVWVYGGPTDLWGTTWTPAQINAANFGAILNFDAVSSSPADYLMQIDFVRITVYYHLGGTTSPSDVPTREYFKVRNQRGEYIGLMPHPVEALKINQDMNSLGSQITLKIPVSTDTVGRNAEIYTTEDGSANYTTEDGVGNYTNEGELPIISAAFQGIDTLIKNGNTVECWLSNYWHPNGKRMFIGKQRRWEDDDEANAVNVTLYSTSYDLDNYYTRGAPFTYTNDQSQTSQNAFVTVTTAGDKGAGWNKYGQTVKPAAANQGAITLKLNGSARVSVSMYSSLNGSLLGSVAQNVAVGVPTDIQFGFPNLLTPSTASAYFFEVAVDPGQSINLYYQNTDVYANGTMYNNNYAGGGGGGWGAVTGDLYFITASGTASTNATFTLKDPSTQMLAPIITDYNLRGGPIQWTAVTIDATGLSLTYTFNVQTVYQALQAILEMSPAGFYYYIDIGAQIIYFKNASVGADFLLQKGVHINSLKLGATNEQSVNTLPFTGGEVTPGVNLYKLYTDPTSIAAFGPLLKPKNDNRVKLDATANAIGNSTLAEYAGEKYFTSVKVIHTTKLDITLLTPGKTVGFRGFGSFKDQVIAQIVRREWEAGIAVLTLGVLPVRLSSEVAQLIQELQQEQTEYNPGTPS
jgi:hypothetical protein